MIRLLLTFFLWVRVAAQTTVTPLDHNLTTVTFGKTMFTLCTVSVAKADAAAPIAILAGVPQLTAVPRPLALSTPLGAQRKSKPNLMVKRRR